MIQKADGARRGRPRTIDPETIVDTATQLLHRQGYAATTMLEIAEACGISRKSLFLYFPSKADLLWSNLDRWVDTLRESIEESAEIDPLDQVIDAVLAGFDVYSHAPEIMRLHVQLIGAEEELAEHSEAHSLAWRRVVADRLLRRTCNEPLADALAYGVWRAMWHALHIWAETGTPSPLPLVRAQLAEFVDAVNNPTRALGRA